MSTTRFWLIAALVGATTALGCGNDSGEAASSDDHGHAHAAAESDHHGDQGEHHGDDEHHGGGEHHGESEGSAPTSFDSPPSVGTQAHCPVMDHDFVVSADSPRSEHDGRHYVFCCPACKPRFDANPSEFLSNAGS